MATSLSQAPNLPLQGRTVLDCSTLLPGPFLGKLLAVQGARVIKIESPDRPDPARTMGSGAYYEDLNGLKELQTLRLDDPADRKVFNALVQQADGLIEGFRPQAKLKLGLDEASLHAINPKLHIVSLVGYPEDGPWRDRAGHDLNFQAVTGCLSLTTDMPGLPLSDLFGAYQGALSLIAAFDSAARRGPSAKGSRIVVSMAETLRAIQSKHAREYQRTGVLPSPGNTLITGKYPGYRIYRAQDGRKIAVGAIETKFWDHVCDILQLPQYKGRGLSEGMEAEEIACQVQARLGAKPWAHWQPLFDAADCCVEPVLDYSEVFKNGV